MEDEFDQDAYWIERHRTYRGDPRSVGNMGASLDDNLRGESRLVAAVEWAATDLKPSKSVLDVGCGYGRVASCFCDAEYDYTGIDVAPAAIDVARAREPRGRFVLGSALNTTLRKKFDLVCALYVCVHFVDEADWVALLLRLSGLLADNGSLLLAEQFPDSEKRPNKHVFDRPLPQYEAVLRTAGLRRDCGFKDRLAGSWSLKGPPPPLELFRA